MLNQNTLTDFMNTFMGYGDFKADTWFIGMEEGGGENIQEIQTRIGVWAKRGRRTLEDCAEYHNEIGASHLFTPPVRSAQRTWDWLMRAQLKSEGRAYDSNASKVMQSERWLRIGSRTCGIELLPLPSPSTNVWHYDKFSNDPALSSRSNYRAAMLPNRIIAIKSAINEYKPRCVVFYSKNYQAYWQEIVGKEFTEVDGLHIAHSRGTSFIVTLHPTAQMKGLGKKIVYWENVASRLAGAK